MNANLYQPYWADSILAVNALILLHLIGAVAIGLAIGYERSYHGRAAGMRTYALVCVASTALTVIIGHPAQWYGGHFQNMEALGVGPVIQGIMTGIGFLGAGVIMKDGFTIRGLSTAASIWMTAVIGILIGVGFYIAAFMAALLGVGIMNGVRWVENILPHQRSMHLTLAYRRVDAPGQEAVKQLIQQHSFKIVDWSYRLAERGEVFEYQLALQTLHLEKIEVLIRELSNSPNVLEFNLSPARS